MNYYWPVIMIVAANTVYHVCAKAVPDAVNPLAALGVTYLVAAATVLVLYFATSPVRDLRVEFAHLNWAPFILGVVIVGLEFGFIWLYKVGWNISIGSLVCNIALAVVLIILGVLAYKEVITKPQLAGVVLCLAGLVLINKK